jgi:Tat protein secretion system quality control protein TatD with DNase activity
MTMFIDTHAHLDHEMFKDDIDQVIDRARQADVKVIIAQGLDPVSNRKVIELAEKYDIVKPALGIYPPDALAVEFRQDNSSRTLEPFDIDEELEFIRNAKPI